MADPVRVRLKMLWQTSCEMLEASAKAAPAGQLATQSYSDGLRFAVRTLWHGALDCKGPPCRHCWEPEGAHADAYLCIPDAPDPVPLPGTHYEPVEEW